MFDVIREIANTIIDVLEDKLGPVPQATRAAKRTRRAKPSNKMPEGGYEAAGLTADDVRRIAITAAIDNGGTVTVSEVYEVVDAAMQAHGVRLSGDYHDRANVRASFNSKKKSFLVYEKKADHWRVTKAGRDYVK